MPSSMGCGLSGRIPSGAGDLPGGDGIISLFVLENLAGPGVARMGALVAYH